MCQKENNPTKNKKNQPSATNGSSNQCENPALEGVLHLHKQKGVKTSCLALNWPMSKI